MIHHVKRATRHLIFWSLIATAIILSGVRLVLTSVESYKSDLENRISVLAGTPVKLGGLGAHVRGISPELVLKDISLASIITTEKPPLHIQEVHLGINLGEFLLYRDVLSASWITVVGAKLTIARKPSGEIAIEGLKAGKGQPLWLLQGQQYEILQSQITWQDQQMGGDPIALEDVNLVVMNAGERHQIKMLAKLPIQYGDGLKMIMDFKGALEKPTEIKGTLFVEGKNVKPTELMSAYLPFDIGMTTGAADIKAWGQWQHARLVSVKFDTHIRQAVFTRKAKANFHINHLDAQVNWRIKDQQWQLDINRFLLEIAEANNKSSKKLPDTIVSIATDIQFQKLKMYAKQLDLAEAAKLTQFFAPLSDEQSKLIGQSQVSGLIKDFSLYAEPDNKSFALAGWFDSINIGPIQAIPGMTNISGKVKGGDNGGVAEFDSQDVHVNYPVLFAKPLLFKQIKGSLAWWQTGANWIVSSPSLELNCTAIKSESRMMVEIPKTDEQPFLDLQTTFKSDDISQAAVLLMPTQIMHDKLKSWLTKAFVGGKVTQGDLLLYGKASGFPYIDNSGMFEAKLDIANAELNYHPEWQHISGINGELSFTKDNILGSFNHGIIGKVEIKKADMLISGLGTDELLTIKGEGQGEINNALNVLQQSPLADRVNPMLTGINLQGTTKAMLELAIPLRPGHETKVDGKAQLKDAQLTVNRLDLKVSKINGDIKFNRQGIYSDAIQAVALGQPIKVNIAQEDQETLINVDGNAKVEDVEQLFAWSGSQLAQGESAYLVQLHIPSANGSKPLQVEVNSTLEGVALNLPGALTKTKDQRKPTTVMVSLSDQLALPIELDYNNELKAAISLNSQNKTINSGHVLIGNGNVKQTKIPGIKLEVNRESLALQDWLGLAASQQANKPTIDINEIKMHSQSAMWNKSRIGLFDLALKRNSKHWSGEIDSAIAKGKFQFPVETKGINPVVLDMDMLNLSALKQLKTQGAATSTEFKPLFNIHSKKTLWQTENLGELTLETQQTPKGMNIKRLELVGDDAKLFSTGNWREAGIKSITHLNGKLEMNKADQLFNKLNITKDLTSTSGIIDFKLNWNAAPWQVALPALRGEMDIKLKEGRILSIEPGFGRMLGILAVAQWIKRLQLDFSDIYAEGLTFNSIKGHFELLNGKATTSTGLVIDAVPAKITITGDTDLVNQTVDHVIKVVPKSLDALPIAGTIMSRVAAMVGKTLTGEDQEGFFFGTQYLVKGSWDNIQISSSHENDGLFQKTWNSITDFPWNEDKKQ